MPKSFAGMYSVHDNHSLKKYYSTNPIPVSQIIAH